MRRNNVRLLIGLLSAWLVGVGHTIAAGPTVGILDGRDMKGWQEALKSLATVREIPRTALSNLVAQADVLVIGDVPLDRQETDQVEAFVRTGRVVVAYGTAGYLEGKYNLTGVLKAGKRLFTLPLIYPCYTLEDDFIPLARWVAESGADGLDVHSLEYVMGSKNPGRPYKGDVPEYRNCLHDAILPNFATWMNRMPPAVPLGLPVVTKAVWHSIYASMSTNPANSPEALASTLADIGFNAVVFTIVRYGLMPFDTEFSPRDPRIQADYLPRLMDACKTNRVQVWGVMVNLAQDYLKSHPDLCAVNMDGTTNTAAVCPRKGGEFYEWQRNAVVTALERFPYINTVLIDEPFFGMNCSACRAAFKQQSGREADANDPDFTAFREDSHMALYFKPLVEAIKKVNPKCHIGLAMPTSEASLSGAAVNLSKYADAGLEIWEPELARIKELSRGARRVINGDKAMVYHTPQNFEFDQLYFAPSERDTESMYKDMSVRGRGVQVNVFEGGSVVYWMKNRAGAQWPGVVQAHEGRAWYCAFSPLAHPPVLGWLKQALPCFRKADSGPAATSDSLPGWPRQTGGRITASVLIDDFTGQGGRFLAVMDSENKLYVWNSLGEPRPGFPVLLEGMARGSSPAAADLDGDGRKDLVAAGQRVVHVFKSDGTPLKGWPQRALGDIRGTPAVADMDGDGKPDVMAGDASGRVHAWDAAGHPLAGWPRDLGGPIEASVAVGDLDGDGRVDMVAISEDGRVQVWDQRGPKAGWPVEVNAAVYSSPALGDLDGDGRLEVVVGANSAKVFAWHADGRPVLGWPQKTGKEALSSPTIADVDGDKRPEVVVGAGDGRVYVWHADGKAAAGWPQTTGMNVEASPAVADVNGDGRMEIIVGSWDKRMYIWISDGKLLPGWPRDLSGYVYSSPAVADLDGNGNLEVAVASDLGQVCVWPMRGAADPRAMPWPMFRQNTRRTGCGSRADALAGRAAGRQAP